MRPEGGPTTKQPRSSDEKTNCCNIGLHNRRSRRGYQFAITKNKTRNNFHCGPNGIKQGFGEIQNAQLRTLNRTISGVADPRLCRSFSPFLSGVSSETMSWVVQSQTLLWPEEITLHRLYPVANLSLDQAFLKPCSRNQAPIQGIPFVELKYIPMCRSTKASTLPPRSR